jgi:hypothetical protein
MVSWGLAFKKGFIIFLWSIVWSIIFGVFLAIALGAGVLAALSSGNLIPAIGGIVVAMIGGIIYEILMIATVVKITMEATLDEARKPPAP